MRRRAVGRWRLGQLVDAAQAAYVPWMRARAIVRRGWPLRALCASESGHGLGSRAGRLVHAAGGAAVALGSGACRWLLREQQRAHGARAHQVAIQNAESASLTIIITRAAAARATAARAAAARAAAASATTASATTSNSTTALAATTSAAAAAITSSSPPGVSQATRCTSSAPARPTAAIAATTRTANACSAASYTPASGSAATVTATPDTTTPDTARRGCRSNSRVLCYAACPCVARDAW